MWVEDYPKRRQVHKAPYTPSSTGWFDDRASWLQMVLVIIVRPLFFPLLKGVTVRNSWVDRHVIKT